MNEMTAKKHYQIAFWITLVVALGLMIGGFFVPPMGEINGSVLTGVGLLFLWPALAFGCKAIEEGNIAKITHGETVIEVGSKEVE